VKRLIRDVAAAHPETYDRVSGWQTGLPVGLAKVREIPAQEGAPGGSPDPQRLGW
jgi:hypothetical protein